MPVIDRPMKPQWFHILLALSDGDSHGYGIQRTVLANTEDRIHLWPAMLYRSLGTLEDAGLIREVSAPDDEAEDERKVWYGLTPAGRRRLAEEADTLARWAELARGADPV